MGPASYLIKQYSTRGCALTLLLSRQWCGQDRGRRPRSVRVTEVTTTTLMHTLEWNIAIIPQLPTKQSTYTKYIYIVGQFTIKIKIYSSLGFHLNRIVNSTRESSPSVEQRVPVSSINTAELPVKCGAVEGNPIYAPPIDRVAWPK